MAETPRLFCFGYGYVARRLADRLRPKGWKIAGTHRQVPRRTPDRYSFSRSSSLSSGALQAGDHILVSIPPDEHGDIVLDEAEDLLREAPPVWIGVLSTTGVYGDHGGNWVDENSPTRPSSPRTARRLAAERAWLANWRHEEWPVHIFRLAGVYGPGRSALDKVRSGEMRRVLAPGHVFSRIHVDDIVSALEAAIARPRPGAIWNLADAEPAEPGEVIAYACRKLGMTPPEAVPLPQADLSSMAQSIWLDSRRVSGERIRRDLGLMLRYPDYRTGIDAVLREENEKKKKSART